MSGDFLTKQAGSDNWYLQLRWPKDIIDRCGEDGRVFKSMRTSDRELARARAADDIAQFRKEVAFCRSLIAREFSIRDAPRWKQEPGTTEEHEDGTRTIATHDLVIRLDATFQQIGSEPNLRPTKEWEGIEELRIPDTGKFGAELANLYGRKKARDLDREILDHWFKAAKVSEAIRKDAERAYKRFKAFLPDKTFLTATRSDCRKLAENMRDVEGLNSQTAIKQIGHLCAACEKALDCAEDFPKLKSNPFLRVAELGDDVRDVRQFDDLEMRRVFDDLPNWTAQERLLWVLCASTGMRREEAFQIDGEELFRGYRTFRFGSKTDMSNRTLPIPSAALPYLPPRIEGPLFKDGVIYVSKGVYGRLDALGISKRLHSCRHRASNRMDSEVQDSVRDTVLGHWDSDLEKAKKSKAKHHYWRGHSGKVIYDAIEMIGLF